MSDDGSAMVVVVVVVVVALGWEDEATCTAVRPQEKAVVDD